MLPVSVCKENMLLKHEPKLGNGGLCPVRKYSLSCNHSGSSSKFVAFHRASQILNQLIPALTAKKDYSILKKNIRNNRVKPR